MTQNRTISAQITLSTSKNALFLEIHIIYWGY